MSPAGRDRERLFHTGHVAWDATRPVPWKRLVVPFLVYAGIALVAFSFFGSSSLPGLAAGVMAGGALYIGIAVIMVKFGWNPPTFGRPSTTQADAPARASSKAAPADAPRSKPAATSRTNAGNRRAPKRH
jgi:hypothetical protein